MSFRGFLVGLAIMLMGIICVGVVLDDQAQHQAIMETANLDDRPLDVAVRRK